MGKPQRIAASGALYEAAETCHCEWLVAKPDQRSRRPTRGELVKFDIEEYLAAIADISQGTEVSQPAG
ncbi:hypothetical protein ABA45_05545 [Marinobacter psychrophilus]|uniref:Uncharacterized protein n=1 Tax=Marinobacter psychrophilus TaxID=330734 RepID=A0A0H4IA75_9GAMM|nr:hypothetical protein [Marinobacter psychrophilus]AKO51952.1 hypothetical protein ABA45_05545 [Marinobacter psychrophilus]